MQPDAASLVAGFADPVHDAQRAFRAALAALSRPGLAVDVGGAGLPRFEPASPAATAVLLALADDSTPVWWQGGAGPAGAALRFHTGAPTVADPSRAAFAVIHRAAELPSLTQFAQGSDCFPERAAMLLIEVDDIAAGPRLTWTGPGIDGSLAVRIDGLPADFVERWACNHAGFPCGVDLIFTCGHRAIGLPRSTQVA
jgi:alpha-D-ribose 1-methylphosphonate 5-triphosphate synthase subunit PhnH